MLRILTILYLSIIMVESAKILAVFPSPSLSHHFVFRPYVNELLNRGHEITLITADPAYPKGETPNKLTEIDIHDDAYAVWGRNILPTARGIQNDFTSVILVIETYVEIFEKLYHLKEVQDIITNKSRTFDLLLLEGICRPALSFTHIYKIPTIVVSSFGILPRQYEYMGASMHPLLYPTMLCQQFHDLTIWQKLLQLAKLMYYHHITNIDNSIEDKALKRMHGPDFPSLKHLQSNVHMILVNTHRIWDSNRPVPPNLIHLGNLHQRPKQEIPEDIEKYLNSSNNGVIYMSLGTNVDPLALPKAKIKMFRKVFTELPYDVLWKVDDNEMLGNSNNIKLFKWLPQADILKHPNVKLFITQAGLQSTDEAITAGVPLVAIPMLADQWFNAEKYVQHKIGIKLDFQTITEDQIKDAIITVINNMSYRQNILKLRSQMQDEPQKPLERAVWWTEHVLRHGGAAHLRSPAANMHWTQYYEINLIIFLISTLFIALSTPIVLSYVMLKKVYRRIF